MPDREDEAIAKLGALAKRRGESPAQLFAAYDRDGSGGLTSGELVELLDDADIGGGPLVRHVYARRIFSEADRDGDDEISYAEAAPLMARMEPPPAPKPPAPKRGDPKWKRLTDAEARDIALRISQGEDVDISQYDADSWGRIEEWNHRITLDKPLTTTTGKPPKVSEHVRRTPPPPAPRERADAALPAAEADQERPGRVFLTLLGLAVAFALMRR